MPLAQILRFLLVSLTGVNTRDNVTQHRE